MTGCLSTVFGVTETVLSDWDVGCVVPEAVLLTGISKVNIETTVWVFRMINDLWMGDAIGQRF